MPLTVKSIEKAKPKDKLYRIADAHGLCLEIPPRGSKRWRYRYRFGGKAKMVSLGVWPEVKLSDAREKRDEMRRQLREGLDPSQHRKSQQVIAEGHNRFEAVAREWFAKFKHQWVERTAKRKMRRLEGHVFPLIGEMPIGEVGAPQIRRVLHRIESMKTLHTAHRVKNIIGEVMRYAVAMGLVTHNPVPDLAGVLPPAKVTHRASITDPKGIGGLLCSIDEYQGSPVTRCAMRLAALAFVRPGELRHAEWKEIDFEKKEWRISAEKMKMRRQHVIPLSKQAIDVLKEVELLTGHSRYVFPSERSKDRAMSNNTVNSALRRMGYTKEEMTGHGFRSMASTNLNEMGFHPDQIERQLAHVEGNKVRAAYNHAEYLAERERMMQVWADYLDHLKAGKNAADFLADFRA
ncbi:tyrosine-type recombinase/integrase [Pseudodesulfovibrio sp. zrk46]|uniref:tyrosine-type recombinase/integrase n=1 Tax=Pseudodesulfovibrio sp. zrk46 TaxID=2725288 RepID=UPI0014499174|nr:tyrosine-type recombinase/integrase [Pseudodesulfovibrio sp. zrk46]QJB56553.1 tyrosine-type recombinase/integrase [Pseudodesulfovibrio sp. zrk46]